MLFIIKEVLTRQEVIAGLSSSEVEIDACSECEADIEARKYFNNYMIIPLDE